MTLEFKRVAFDVSVMGNIRQSVFGMHIMTVTQTARMPSTTTLHNEVCGVLVELVCVLYRE